MTTGTGREARKAHPVTDMFPMLDEEDLADLAESVRRRGLEHAIVLTPDGLILDGRNRLRACEIAGVTPTFTTYEGDDPDGYALEVNIARRSLTKGQKAMIVACACPESGQTIRQAADASGVTRTRIGLARVVIQHAPELVEDVKTGTLGLDAAYEVARHRKEVFTEVPTGVAPDSERWDYLVEHGKSLTTARDSLLRDAVGEIVHEGVLETLNQYATETGIPISDLLAVLDNLGQKINGLEWGRAALIAALVGTHGMRHTVDSLGYDRETVEYYFEAWCKHRPAPRLGESVDLDGLPEWVPAWAEEP